jgi:F-type H+-transporting ATPase subunit a
MEASPFGPRVAFVVGALPVGEAVVTTWAIMVTLVAGGWLVKRRIALAPGRLQAAVELVVAGIARQISDTLGRPAEPFLPFLGTLFLFLVAANLAPLLPGVHAPTARLETTAALAFVVFAAAHVYGVRTVGVRRHLARYLKPTPLLLPLNVLSELTRTFSLAVRLFGNIMSHELMLGLVLAIAGLLVPVPLMVLGIIIGLVQAYIFTVLATIYLGAAIGAFEVH